ncbi:MAG: 50S ribosomal protein L29 [Actinomycetota bacterium]
MKASEIREMSPDDVAKQVADARQELFNLRFQHATGALEDTSRLNLARRELARLLTVQGEMAEGQEGGTR